MLPLSIILGLFLIAGFVTRYAHIFWIRRQFKKPVSNLPFKVPAIWKQHRLWQFAKKDFVAPAAAVINAGQALFHFSQIDPGVLDAIDRIHDPSKINSYDEILAHLANKKEQGMAVWNGAVSKYKGEFGERILGAKLEAAGHLVEPAESATQQGWDAIVDGEKVNYKVGTSTSHIQEHLNRFPDIQVVTVSEHASAFADNPDVTCFDDISGVDIAEVTENAMSSVVNSTSFHFKIPIVTIVLSSVRNFSPTLSGHSNFSTALQYTAADAAGVGIGVAAGAKAGALVGAWGGPLGVALGGILGGIGGAVGGKWLASEFKERDLKSALIDLDTQIASYAKYYIQGLQKKATALDRAVQKLSTRFSLKHFFAPTPADVLRTEIRRAHKRWATSCRELAAKLQQNAKNEDGYGFDFLRVGRHLLSNPPTEAVYSSRLSRCLILLRKAVDKVQLERKKLGYS